MYPVPPIGIGTQNIPHFRLNKRYTLLESLLGSVLISRSDRVSRLVQTVPGFGPVLVLQSRPLLLPLDLRRVHEMVRPLLLERGDLTREIVQLSADRSEQISDLSESDLTSITGRSRTVTVWSVWRGWRGVRNVRWNSVISSVIRWRTVMSLMTVKLRSTVLRWGAVRRGATVWGWTSVQRSTLRRHSAGGRLSAKRRLNEVLRMGALLKLLSVLRLAANLLCGELRLSDLLVLHNMLRVDGTRRRLDDRNSMRMVRSHDGRSRWIGSLN